MIYSFDFSLNLHIIINDKNILSAKIKLYPTNNFLRFIDPNTSKFTFLENSINYIIIIRNI